ncbi:MOSC domain-containing protein [Rhodobacteraceae bacterium nBUS_24]
MSCLLKSEYSGTITWLGRVLRPEDSIRSEALNAVETTFDGIVGESHSGVTRPSCLRVTMLHPKSTEIRNTRQLSILSAEEIAEIAASIGLEQLDPSWLGASIVISGVPDFTHIPPGSRLQTAAGTTLTVDLENAPCNWPAKEIEADRPGHGKAFRSAAKGRRGITAWVERPGPLSIGDTVNLFIPTQRTWQLK